MKEDDKSGVYTYTILLIEIKIYNNIIYVDCVWKSMSEYFIDIKLRFCTIEKVYDKLKNVIISYIVSNVI